MGSIQNLKLSFQKIKNSIEPIFGTSLLFLEKHFLSILALGLLLIYSGVLWENPILKYDDSSLLSPLRHTQNLKHYFEQIKNGYVLDIQPLRDLTFWIEIQIWETTKRCYIQIDISEKSDEICTCNLRHLL